MAQSCPTLCDQAPLSMGFSRHENRSGWPCPSPGNLPNAGIEPGSSALRDDSLPPEPPGKHPVFSPKSLFIWLSGVLVAT